MENNFNYQHLDEETNIPDLMNSVKNRQMVGIVSEIDGGIIAYAIGEENADAISSKLNCEDKMRTVLYKLIDSLPELDSEDKPLEGSEAVSILSQLWKEIKESVK